MSHMNFFSKGGLLKLNAYAKGYQAAETYLEKHKNKESLNYDEALDVARPQADLLYKRNRAKSGFMTGYMQRLCDHFEPGTVAHVDVFGRRRTR